jgi:predicted metal-dependent peptidase
MSADTTKVDEKEKLSPEELEQIEKNKEEARKLGLAQDEAFLKKVSELQQRMKSAVDSGNEAEVEKIKKEAELFAEEFKPVPYRRGEFDPDFMRLYQEEPFLGGVSVGISKVVTDKMPTAFVGVRPNGKSHEAILGLNPKFFRGCTERQRMGILKHELLHLIFQHIFTRSIGEHSYQVLWNWATDLAINSIIGADNLPRMVLCPGVDPIDPKTGKPIDNEYGEFIKNAPPMESSDWYFEELRKIQERIGDKDSSIAIASGIGTMDDHASWKDVDPEVQEQIKDKVRGLIKDGVLRADRNNDWGSIPNEIQQAVRRMISNEIDWRSVVRNFIGRCRTMERNSTIRKLNKKLPYMFPGVKRPLRAKFAVFIDQSGSMSDEDICLLFGELENFAQETELDVYHFDTQIDVNSHTVWKKGKPFPAAHRTRSGGTDFSAISSFCNNPKNTKDWSGVVILTDGYADTMPAIVGSRVLWVITETGTINAVRPGDLAVQMKKEKTFKSY